MIVQCSTVYMVYVVSCMNHAYTFVHVKCIQFSVEIVLVFSLAFVFFPPARIPFVKICRRET